MRTYCQIMTAVIAQISALAIGWTSTDLAIENVLILSFAVALAVHAVFGILSEIAQGRRKTNTRCRRLRSQTGRPLPDYFLVEEATGRIVSGSEVWF